MEKCEWVLGTACERTVGNMSLRVVRLPCGGSPGTGEEEGMCQAEKRNWKELGLLEKAVCLGAVTT